MRLGRPDPDAALHERTSPRLGIIVCYCPGVAAKPKLDHGIHCDEEHHFAEVVILVAVYAVIELWLRHNARAIAHDDADKRRSPFA